MIWPTFLSGSGTSVRFFSAKSAVNIVSNTSPDL